MEGLILLLEAVEAVDEAVETLESVMPHQAQGLHNNI